MTPVTLPHRGMWSTWGWHGGPGAYGAASAASGSGPSLGRSMHGSLEWLSRRIGMPGEMKRGGRALLHGAGCRGPRGSELLLSTSINPGGERGCSPAPAVPPRSAPLRAARPAPSAARKHLFLHQKNSQHLIQRGASREPTSPQTTSLLYMGEPLLLGHHQPLIQCTGHVPPPHINPKGTLQQPCTPGGTGSRVMPLAATQDLAQGTVPNICRHNQPWPWGLPRVGRGGVWWQDPPCLHPAERCRGEAGT